VLCGWRVGCKFCAVELRSWVGNKTSDLRVWHFILVISYEAQEVELLQPKYQSIEFISVLFFSAATGVSAEDHLGDRQH
jgi:hypothetical protein